MQKDNKRYFTRVPFKSEATLASKGGRVGGEIENLSLLGALLKANGDFTVGLPVEVEIFLAEPASDINLVLGGTVVRSDPGKVAVEFSGMYLDEYERLRDTLAHLVGDKRKVVNEFLAYMTR